MCLHAGGREHPSNAHPRERGSRNGSPVRCWGSRSQALCRGSRSVKPPAQPAPGTDRYCISGQCADAPSSQGVVRGPVDGQYGLQCTLEPRTRWPGFSRDGLLCRAPLNMAWTVQQVVSPEVSIGVDARPDRTRTLDLGAIATLRLPWGVGPVEDNPGAIGLCTP